MNKVYRKYNVEITLCNTPYLKRLYHYYLHESIFDDILNTLIVFAIIFTFFEVLSEFFFKTYIILQNTIHSFSVLILFVFGLELFREYALSKTKKEFFRKNWLDFALVLFLSLHFFTAGYFGIAKFEELAKLKHVIGGTEHFKTITEALGFDVLD